MVEAGSLAGSLQPVVVAGNGLALRPWAIDDAPAVVRAFTDPDIQHWHFRRYETLAEAQVWINSELEGWSSERAVSWAIVRMDSDAVLGRVAIYPNLQDGYGEVTYWVLPDARGQRIATRATVAATKWAHDLGLHRVQLEHSTRNEASRGVAERAGFVSEGVRRAANLHDDGWHDMHLYSHLSTD